jgi:hypothetical protein
MGTSDWAWLERKADEAERVEAELLRCAKEKALFSGKEPFDFRALCCRYDPSSEMSASSELTDPAGTATALERRYYIDYPNVMTIAEFAETLERIRSSR